MNSLEKNVKPLKPLAGKSRLQMLKCIQQEISNAGEIAQGFIRHWSTIPKHPRVLLKARIVEKVPSLTSTGQLSVQYSESLLIDAERYLTTVKDHGGAANQDRHRCVHNHGLALVIGGGDAEFR